tara:strand:+ start:12715 stop:13998 length:1284 start_codon:yes stop_codon:yes gene_type:complete
MASIEQRTNGTYHIQFRFPVNGKPNQFNRSLKTDSKKTALVKCGLAEDTINLIETGRISLPSGMTKKEVGNFILSGGKLTEKPTAIQSVKLETLWNEYEGSYSIGKDPSSVRTEKVHKNNLVEFLGNLSLQEFTTDRLQKYVKERINPPKNRKRMKVGPVTVGKEIQTFNFLWGIAQSKGYISKEKPSPTKGIMLPKAEDQKPFQTWEQIEAIVQHLDDEKEIKKEWDSLFLREEEIEELLQFVKENARHPFIYSSFSIAIFTGARRSEIMRSEITDFNFTTKRVQIRQKKKDKDKSLSYRFVDLHPKLIKIMKDYFENDHVGSKFTIASLPDPALLKNKIVAVKPNPLSEAQMRHYFQRTLKDSKWEVLKGWHVLRHSFCSNLARKGIPDGVICSWMGHSPKSKITERYKHLFPEDTASAINLLFS